MTPERSFAPAPASLLDILERREPQHHGSGLWVVDAIIDRDHLVEILIEVVRIHPAFRCRVVDDTLSTGQLEVVSLDEYADAAVVGPASGSIEDGALRMWARARLETIPSSPGLPLLLWARSDGSRTAVLLRLDEHYCDYDLAQRAIATFLERLTGSSLPPPPDDALQWAQYDEAVASTFADAGRQSTIDAYWAGRVGEPDILRFGRLRPAGRPTTASRVLASGDGPWSGPLATAALTGLVADAVLDLAGEDAVALQQVVAGPSPEAPAGSIATSTLARRFCSVLLDRQALARGLPAIARAWQQAVRHAYVERRSAPSLHRLLEEQVASGGIVVKTTVFRYDQTPEALHPTTVGVACRPVAFDHPIDQEQNPYEAYVFLAVTPGGGLTGHIGCGSQLDADLGERLLDELQVRLDDSALPN